HALLERYSRAISRPDNATIVVVANTATTAVEPQNKLRFSGWVGAVTPEAEAEPEPEGAVRPEGGVTTQGAVRAEAEPVNLGAPTGQKKAGEFVAAGVPDLLSLSWVGPADRRAETETVDREILLKGIGLLVLNQKLADRALEPGTPYVAAQAQLSPSLLDSASVTAINVAVPAGKWLPALDEVTAEERMLLRDGVSAGDLKRALASLRTALETRTKQAATRKSATIADEIVAAANDDKLFVSPAQELAFAAPILAVLTPTQVNAGLNQLFAAHGPILFRSAQQEPAGEAKLAQALEGAYTRPLGAATAAAALSWPYDDFGKPGAIVAKTTDAKLGTTLVRFANGTRLMVKPTQFEGDRISVAVLLGNGRSGVRPALARAIWESSLFPLAGTKKLPLFQITQWAQQSGKVITLGMDAGIRAFVLRGQTRPADLLTEMQLLAAYARDPGFRSEAAEKAKALAPTLAGQIAASAQETYARASQALMAGNDPRFESVPSAADLASVTSDDLPQLLKGSLASQADVIMVGDVTVDQAIQAVQATFGAGSAGQPVAAQPAHVSIPNGRAEPYVVEHEGRADQAFYGEYFRLPDYFADPKISEAADVAAAIISSRLVDSVREQLGITYSPQVHAVTSIELPGQGYLEITLETPPANFAKFHALLSDTLRDLATKPVAADELARAKQPLIQTERKKRETNGFWVGSLAQIMREPRAEGEVVGKLDKISAVSAADVQALIGRYVAGHQPVVVIAKAKGARE
ncbi:MAG: M16 family metallopeptidase, partial [Sphingomonas sp.]